MVNIEYVFVCLLAPLLLSLFVLRGDARRFMLFFIIGMAVCLVSGYFNSMFLELSGYSQTTAVVYITPFIEEIFKFFPLLFWVLVFMPKKQDIYPCALAIGLGFAILENCVYLQTFGTEDLGFILIRGFATGVLHGICTLIVGYGISYVYDKKKLAATGTFGLMCLAITLHALYNLFAVSDGALKVIANVLPISVAAVIIVIQIVFRLKARNK